MDSGTLFLDTLEDYQSTNLLDAVAFETVITDAIAGIGSTPKGMKILDALVIQWDPLQPGSLIWRVFAMNQIDAREELGKLLKTAVAKKEIPLESSESNGSPGLNAVFSAASMIGKLNGYYGKLSKLALETDSKKSPIGALLKRLEVDLFGMTVGDAIFKIFRVNQLADFVGEKIIQSLMLQRSGVSHSDAMNLVRQQARLQLLSRRETIERLVRARSLLRADVPIDSPRSTQALYDVWDEMKSTDDGMKALRSSRIAVVAALMESINFYKIMITAPDEDTKGKLVQSGASLLSALITITMTPYYALLKNSVRSQSWKMVGGGLSSFSVLISVWMDANKATNAYKKRNFSASAFYTVKGFGNFSSSAAILIDATSTAAPLLKKLASRYGNRVVIGAVEVVTKRVAAWATLRVVTWLTGWEVMVALLLLEAMQELLVPNELESWCSRCSFGTGNESVLRIKDFRVTLYTDPAEQEKDFSNAMTNLS